MKTSRDIADDIIETAIDGDIERANAMFREPAAPRQKGQFRSRSIRYIVALACIALVALGIDALDGKIIDHL